MKLGAWLSEWLSLYVDVSNLAHNTILCYHRAVSAVPPDLAEMDLADLSPLDLRRWLVAVAKETPRAAQLDRVMLSRSLTIAAKLGLCRPGMVDSDVCPQIVHEPKKATVLTREQLLRYMAAASVEDCAPVLLLCCCGLRRGEAMGARWSDLDLQAGTLTVSVQRERREPLPLKNKAAHRTIALPEEVLAVLRRWPRSLPWVCGCSQTDVYRSHRRAIAAARVRPVTLHGLRHTMATLAAMSGEPIKLIQGALGHAHFALTADLYADHLPQVSTVTERFLRG